MNLLLRLLRLVPLRHLCRHPDDCPTWVGPHALLCEHHANAETAMSRQRKEHL